MPTNILRQTANARQPQPRTQPQAARAVTGPRRAVLRVGRVSIRIELDDTATADLVWRALPLHSAAVPWGSTISFATPLETGRDRTARLLATLGELYFWVEQDRIVVPFGPTPISRRGECRLQSPANVWAHALDDVTALAVVTPSEKVALIAEPPSRAPARS